MRESFIRDKNMEKEDMYIMMDLFIMDNGLVMKETVMVISSIQTGITTKANGKTIRNTDMVNIKAYWALVTKETIIRIKKMALDK